MISLVKKNSAFFIPYFIFLLIGGAALILGSKTGIHLYINKYHYSSADIFFKYWTDIGLGWLIIPVVAVLCFTKLRYVIIAVICFIVSFLINDTIKKLVDSPRPSEVFSELHQSIYTVPGVEMYGWNSFPSGHTATAFCLLSLLALITTKNYLKFTLFVMALLVAYSRMYLSEHFLIDVYVASIIGVGTTLIFYYVGMKASWLKKNPVMDEPLIKTSKRK
jgi:membrane-associated phospholipid phosphatase